jgi:hypothetical protein
MTSTLVAVFRTRLTLRILPADDLERLVRDGPFHDRGLGALPGFYDWLWHAQQLVGFQFWPTDATRYLLAEVAGREDTDVEEGACFSVFFGHPRPLDVTSSEDQDFAAQILESNDGTLAIVLDLSWIPEDAILGMKEDPSINWDA